MLSTDTKDGAGVLERNIAVVSRGVARRSLGDSPPSAALWNTKGRSNMEEEHISDTHKYM